MNEEERIKLIARETVHEMFMTLGVDVGDPISLQKDFQHLREWRTTTDEIRHKGFMAALGLIVAGSIALMIVGFKTKYL